VKNQQSTINRFEQGYLIENPALDHHPWILGLQGTPYDIGYQHGYLLAEVIRQTASGFLTPVFAQFGGWQPEKGKPLVSAQIETGRSILVDTFHRVFEPALKEQAPDLLTEMQGIADGIQKAGVDIPLIDLLVGNCIPEITEPLLYAPEADAARKTNPVPPKGCSDCVVWRKATVDGRLIHGTNYDYDTFDVLHKGIGIAVVNPDDGHAFIAQCLPGTVGHYRGMNVSGVTAGEPTSDSIDRNIRNNPRITHAMHMRHIIQFAADTTDAVEIMHRFKGTTGFNHVVGDSKVPTAVDIEASCNQVAVIHPEKNVHALWAANHFVSYPGYKGYSGPNLTQGQVAWWENTSPIDTVEKWSAVVKEESEKRTFSWHRYECMQAYVKEHYGAMDVPAMINLLGSHPLCRTPDSKTQLAMECEKLYGLKGPIVDQKLASIFSAVFDTKELTAWVAVGAEPAQKGTYWPVNLDEHLAKLR
jgi:predicted choloylglycine hydrolase